MTYRLTVSTDPELATLRGALTVRMFLFANPLVWRCHKLVSIKNNEGRAQHAGAHKDTQLLSCIRFRRTSLSFTKDKKNAATIGAAFSQGGTMKCRKTCSNLQIQLPSFQRVSSTVAAGYANLSSIGKRAPPVRAPAQRDWGQPIAC